MESTVMAAKYMALGEGDGAVERMTRLKRRCEAMQGDFTLLWHNSQLDTQRRMALYEAVMGE
jgi:hypothetical protein